MSGLGDLAYEAGEALRDVGVAGHEATVKLEALKEVAEQAGKGELAEVVGQLLELVDGTAEAAGDGADWIDEYLEGDDE